MAVAVSFLMMEILSSQYRTRLVMADYGIIQSGTYHVDGLTSIQSLINS